jgi:hypothetical protein
MSSDRGRKLNIVARRGPGGPVAVAITVATAAACGSNVVVDGGATSSASSAGGMSAASSATGASGTISVSVGATTSSGGAGPCPEGLADTFVVEVPPEGVPADAGQICSVVMGPVESNQAARFTLVKDPQALHLAKGELTVDPSLLSDVVGLPTIEVVASPLAELQQMVATNVSPTSSGFSFDAEWPPFQLEPSDATVMVLRATFDLACPPNQTQQVEAHTHVNLCDEPDDVAWVSSGDECTICGIIAEMAPSPIVPDRSSDAIALGQVIRLRLVIVARIGASLLLLAEHDGGADVDYEWQVSGGELVPVTRDIALWTPPLGGVLQVAVTSEDGAAVASYCSVPVREAGLVA